jgi:hypothetical protein
MVSPTPDAPGRPLAEQLLAPRKEDDQILDLRTWGQTEVRKALTQIREVGLNLSGLELSYIIFGAPDYGDPPIDLTNIAFPPHTTFAHVSFARMRLDGVIFARCQFIACDFRYVLATGTNFKNTRFEGCDFYSATFGPSSVFFGGAVFDGVSLGDATLAGVTGLTWQTFACEPPALIQEHREAAYRQFLEPTAQDRERGHTVDDAVANAPRDAATVYRALSRMWASQGETDHARRAYVKSKQLERSSVSPWRARRLNRSHADRTHVLVSYGLSQLFNWLWLCFSAALRYGDSFFRVSFALVAVTLLPAIVYSLAGGVRHVDGGVVHGFFFCWLFSIEQVTASTAHHLESTSPIVDLVAAIQTVMTITLLGLLGSAFASRLRGS